MKTKKLRLSIEEKYAYIYDGDGKQVKYFENFESKSERRRVIPISRESIEGGRFITKNDGKVLDMDIVWFGHRIKGKPMFIDEKFGAFAYIIIMV